MSAGHNETSPLLVVILGPTGIGKTGLAIELAKQFQTEILSADSRQFYRELKIGTASPTPREMSEARHHFIGHISVEDYYNASIYEIQALELLEKLFQKMNPVLLAGGSGLYIDSLCKGIDDLPHVDQQVRKHLLEQFREKGLSFLQGELKRLDPVHYGKVDLNNPKRILKALEVAYITGKPYSSFLSQPNKERWFRILKIGLNMERDALYERINQRVDRMMEKGLEEEARSLYRFRNLNALNTVGYKELFEYFEGKITRDKAVELIKRNSRHYAKRQLTWFSRNKEIHWFHPGETLKVADFIKEQLK